MNDIKKLLGKQIKYYREKNELTQEELAEKINVNFRTISLVERGHNFVTAETLTNISKALNVSPKKLFDFDDEFSEKTNIKEKLFNLINENEDKVFTIYKIVKGYLE